MRRAGVRSGPPAPVRRGAERHRPKTVSDAKLEPPHSRRILPAAAVPGAAKGKRPMRSILLYLIGVPLPIILLLAFCTHHF